MIINPGQLAIILLLVLLSILDLKYYKKGMIAIIPTTAVIITFIVMNSNLYFGILGLLFGLLFYEFDYIGGTADIKLTALLGLTVSNLSFFLYFIGLFVGIGFLYKGLYKSLTNKEEIPFIPVYLIVYLVLVFI